MTLTGLSLLQVLTVLGVAGGLTVLLYLLKLRRRRVDVPFVKLWEQVLAEKQTTRLFSQLKRLLSLLISLLVIAALAFALGDPRPEGAIAEGRTLVVLVDASASMQATDVTPSRFDEAKRRATRLIAGLGPNDRMLIAQLDASATPVSPLTGEPRVLENALETLSVTEVAASLRAGLHLALDVLRGQSDPEIILLSDGAFDDDRFDPASFAGELQQHGIDVSWVRIGSGSDNAAISAFSVRRYPLDKSQSEVLVEMYNPSGEDQALELKLLGDGEVVDVQRVTVRAGERLRRFFRNVSGVDQTLEAELSRADGSRDQLRADDRAFARLPERRRARVLVVSEGNLYLQAALLLDEYLDVTELAPSAWPTEQPHDVVIFDDWVPPSAPETPALYLNPMTEETGRGPFVVRGELEAPYFDRLDRRHPLLKWTALRDVNVATSLDVELQDGDRAIARDASGPPLVVVGRRSGHPFVAFTFDVRRSDLPLRVAWPLLLLNTIDWFVQEDVGFVSSFDTGDTWQIPVAGELSRATIIDPHGDEREVPVVDGRAIYAGLRAGFHRVQTGEGEEVFAANLGAGTESDIAPADHVRVGALEAGSPSEGEVGVRRELWLYLVLLVLAIVVVEWFTYHRRWTV